MPADAAVLFCSGELIGEITGLVIAQHMGHQLVYLHWVWVRFLVRKVMCNSRVNSHFHWGNTYKAFDRIRWKIRMLLLEVAHVGEPQRHKL